MRREGFITLRVGHLNYYCEKRGVTLDPVTVFRICFVIGLLAIPLLYFLFGRGEAGRDQDQARNEGERVEHERRSEV
jgi:preprotein translocase subunit Sec61beta